MLNVVALQPQDIRVLLSDAPFPWWIAGGWALDLFMGEQSRPHFDTDIAIARRDQTAAQRHLDKWGFQYAIRDSNGNVAFQPWERGQTLEREIHGVWARESPDAPWRFEFLFHEIEGQVWSFRYFGSVQHPVQTIYGRTPEGIWYLQPEITLLYKAARMREVDVQDFQRVLPRLASGQRVQLGEDIISCWPQHPWLDELG
jgi:hypothetical protein